MIRYVIIDELYYTVFPIVYAQRGHSRLMRLTLALKLVPTELKIFFRPFRDLQRHKD